MDVVNATPVYPVPDDHYHGTSGPWGPGNNHPPTQQPYPDPHDPGYWASEGDWPLPPSTNQNSPKQPIPPPPKPCPAQPCVVPPPIPPVRYVPGMDVQEQLSTMATQVNTCIDRWNHIQAECYAALNRVVGAAVSNDVYYEPTEVRLSSGYSSADGCEYHIIESLPVDKAGRPIRLQLMTAYNAGQGSVREGMLQKSFVSSANAIITAVTPANQWSGLCMVNGNPQATQEPNDGEWLCGWTKRGVMRLLPSTETTVESARRNQIVDCIGPVIPIVLNGKPTEIAAEFSAEPGAIQAVGWKQCNGNKVLFSCGFNDQPGCSVKNVADLLVSMGVTTAAVTCYMTAYGTPTIGGFVKQPLENTASVTNVIGDVEKVNVQNNQTDDLSGDSSLGITGGMAYIGKITEKPLEFQLPQNAAFWVISKRPTKAGWPNRWTGEIADVCQTLGQNATELESVQGKIDLEQVQILDLLRRVGKNEVNIGQLQTLTATHSSQISQLDTRISTAENNITSLQGQLSQETQERIDENQKLTEALAKETQERITNDNKMADQILLFRTELTEEITARNQADENLINAIQNEANTRQTADNLLKTQLELLQTQTNSALTKEIADRINEDEKLQTQLDQNVQELQEQIDEINKQKEQKYVAGKGLTETVQDSTTTFNVYPGGGVRINAANQLTLFTGKGVGVVNGKLQALISDCFQFNEKGEITMSCCDNKTQTIAGTGLDYSADPQTGELSINLQPPMNGDIGGVKAGNGVTITEDGTINVNGGGTGGEYTLPPATKTTLGGVIVGQNLTVDDNGNLDAPAQYELPVASPTTLGGIKLGSNLVSDENGVVSATIPDLPESSGDTVLAGTGINVVKDGETGTATVSLNEQTQQTLASVGDIAEEVNGIKGDIRTLSTAKANKSDLENTNLRVAAIDTKAENAAEQAAQAAETAATATDKANDAMPLSGGTFTGDVSFAQTTRSAQAPTITGLPLPTEPGEVANKEYVDSAINGAIGDIDFSELQEGIQEAKTAADNAQTTATAAANTANAAAQNAQAATQAATEAQNTANTANTTATAAQTAANNAGATALEAKEMAETLEEGGPYLPLAGGNMGSSNIMFQIQSVSDGYTGPLTAKIYLSSRGVVGRSVFVFRGGRETPDSNIIITGLSTPGSSDDAANKGYVDSLAATSKNIITDITPKNQYHTMANGSKVGIYKIGSTNFLYFSILYSSSRTVNSGDYGTMTFVINTPPPLTNDSFSCVAIGSTDISNLSHIDWNGRATLVKNGTSTELLLTGLINSQITANTNMVISGGPLIYTV